MTYDPPDRGPAATTSRFYSEYVSTHFAGVGGELHQSYDKRLLLWKSYLADLLPAEVDAPILELGCGTGFNLFAMTRLGYVNVLGVDISQECVDVCTGEGLPARVVPVGQLRGIEGSFQTVLLYDVLEHFDPDAAATLLDDVAPLLRETGELLISVPSCDYPPNLSLRYADLTHRALYNQTSLGQLLRIAGFEPTLFRPLNALTVADPNPLRRASKAAYAATVARAGEMFWKLLLLSQGVTVPSCRPTLVAVARRRP